MRILINSHYLNRKTTGLGRYANQIREALQCHDVVFVCKSRSGFKYLRYVYLFLSEMFIPFFLLLVSRKSIHISPAFSVPILGFNGRSIIVWHDLAFFKFPECYSMLEKIYFKYNFILLKHGSHRIVVPSGYVASEMQKLGVRADRIFIIHPYSNMTDISVSSQIIHTNQKYFLHISNNHPRKNLENTVNGFLKSNYASDYYLYIVGNFETSPSFLSERIRVITEVSDGELKSLYKYAEAILIFSIDEGFGYPVIEAASVKTVALTSGLSALREFGLEEAECVSVSEIRESINRLSDRRNELNAKMKIIREYYTKDQFESNWRDLIGSLF